MILLKYSGLVMVYDLKKYYKSREKASLDWESPFE